MNLVHTRRRGADEFYCQSCQGFTPVDRWCRCNGQRASLRACAGELATRERARRLAEVNTRTR